MAGVVQMSETPARWQLPTQPLGTNQACWAADADTGKQDLQLPYVYFTMCHNIIQPY